MELVIFLKLFANSTDILDQNLRGNSRDYVVLFCSCTKTLQVHFCKIFSKNLAVFHLNIMIRQRGPELGIIYNNLFQVPYVFETKTP
jgi:hypothetical protein